jgi:hypothetical protein
MRAKSLALAVLTALVAAAGSARATVIVIPDVKPAANTEAYNSPRIEQPWINEQPQPAQLVEKPIGEIISQRLGLADGTAELFRYQVQGAPSDKTMLDGVIDGGGIKLKLSW